MTNIVGNKILKFKHLSLIESSLSSRQVVTTNIKNLSIIEIESQPGFSVHVDRNLLVSHLGQNVILIRRWRFCWPKVVLTRLLPTKRKQTFTDVFYFEFSVVALCLTAALLRKQALKSLVANKSFFNVIEDPEILEV